MKTVLLKFAGPLQSWGTDSHFETRYTDFHPSKSAVIGMLAASLGYRRNEDEKIRKLNDLDFGVRVDQRGSLLRDYQIATVYKNGKKDRNYVTNRYYLEDAIFVVAIGGEDQYMDEVIEALKKPYFQPFLGKRSNPLNPDFIIETTFKNVKESLENLDWQASNWYKRELRNCNYVDLDAYLDGDLIEGSTFRFRKDRVRSFSQKYRQFEFRGEKQLKIRVKDEHDAFMF